MLTSKKVKRYETEIKAFGKCLNSRFKEGTTAFREKKSSFY
jgi:hypothetical protein